MNGYALLGRKFRLGNGGVYRVNTVSGPTRWAWVNLRQCVCVDDSDIEIGGHEGKELLKLRVSMLTQALRTGLIEEV